MLFKEMEKNDYEEVIFCQDKKSGLKAIIAIHDTTLGPALGGCRMWPYDSEEEAVIDALRLAKGMTYKNAAAGLNIGGAKAVIIGDPKTTKSESLFRAFGRYVEGLSGRYITAEDVNTTVEDMNYIYMETDYVTGSSAKKGGSGNPSPKTALGVFCAMKATAKQVFGSDSLAGKVVAVQGVGNVSYRLCEMLHKEGAQLIVTDIKQESIDRAVNDFDAKAVKITDIYSVAADIFAPCALGGILNDETIPQLQVKMVCGAANNQLLDSDKHGEQLAERNIAYAPDYIANSGGVINVTHELVGYNEDAAIKQVKNIYEQIRAVFEIARSKNITTAKAADVLAEKRISDITSIHKTFLSSNISSLTKR